MLNIFRSTLRLSSWIAGFYLICRIGGRVTERFQDVAYSVYDCPWYAMPPKIAKTFPTIMAVAQKPIYILGIFDIRCINETFRKVI